MEFIIWIREKKGSAWEQKAMGDAVFYGKANRKPGGFPMPRSWEDGFPGLMFDL